MGIDIWREQITTKGVDNGDGAVEIKDRNDNVLGGRTEVAKPLFVKEKNRDGKDMNVSNKRRDDGR